LHALADFMLVGPLIANAIYEKSRRLEKNEDTGFGHMIVVIPRSGKAGLFVGAILLGLFLLWMHTAILIFALFFGMVTFPSTLEILPMLFLTPNRMGAVHCRRRGRCPLSSA
jgi:uncharacterized membrane protein